MQLLHPFKHRPSLKASMGYRTVHHQGRGMKQSRRETLPAAVVNELRAVAFFSDERKQKGKLPWHTKKKEVVTQAQLSRKRFVRAGNHFKPHSHHAQQDTA